MAEREKNAVRELIPQAARSFAKSRHVTQIAPD